MVCGVWNVVCGVWCVVCDVWCVVYGVWSVECGVWCMVWCAGLGLSLCLCTKVAHPIGELPVFWVYTPALKGSCRATWKREFKLPWREADPPNRLNAEVDSDQ